MIRWQMWSGFLMIKPKAIWKQFSPVFLCWLVILRYSMAVNANTLTHNAIENQILYPELLYNTDVQCAALWELSLAPQTGNQTYTNSGSFDRAQKNDPTNLSKSAPPHPCQAPPEGSCCWMLPCMQLHTKACELKLPVFHDVHDQCVYAEFPIVWIHYTILRNNLYAD